MNVKTEQNSAERSAAEREMLRRAVRIVLSDQWGKEPAQDERREGNEEGPK